MSTSYCAVIGGGLTGATAAYMLRSWGIRPVVFEAHDRVGGHVQNEWIRGIPYEPNGAHIFHTSDEEVWRLASSVVEFVPYQHRVLTRIRGNLLSWPIQVDEIRDLDEWPKIEAELKRRPTSIDSTNFETWCVSAMGDTLYSLFVKGYTEKQWGRPPSQLSSSFAPKRVELRTDGFLGLFRDPHQGWPKLGYGALVEGLLREVELTLCTEVNISSLAELVAPGAPVIVTAPLDAFFENALGELEWRGVRLVPRFIPGIKHAQPVAVVNEPSADVAYTRTIETKWVLPDLSETPGTVVCEEYPGARTKHYPVDDVRGMNRRMQEAYMSRAALVSDYHLIPAGRMANYQYINMDEAMRQGINAAKAAFDYLNG